MAKVSLTNTYKKYPTYKDSGVEWLGKVPDTWNTEFSKRIFKELNRRGEKGLELGSVTQDRGVVLRSESALSVWNPQGELDGYKTIRSGQFVLSLRSFEGGVEYSEVDALVSPAYTVMALDDKNSQRYFKWLLKSKNIISALQVHTRGIRQGQNVSYEDFSKINIVIPPKEEQEKIAKFLDEQTTRVDESIAKKQRLIELLKEKRTATINHAVTKGLDPKAELIDSGVEWIGKIPKSWRVEKIKYLAPLGTKKTSIDIATSTYIALENAEGKTGRYLPSAEAVNPDSVVSVFSENDVLFSKLRPYLAKVLTPSFDGYATGEFLVLRPNKNVLQGYLKYRLLSQDFITIVNDSTYGAQMPRASWNFIGSQFITVPTLEEQKTIANFLDDAIDKYQSAIDDVQKSITLLQEFKSSLISHAVTGKIKV